MTLLSINWYSIFYWLSVADNAKNFFVAFIVIFTIISVIATICFILGQVYNDLKCPKDGIAERAKKWMWWAYPFMIFFWSLYILTPSEEDTLFIIAGGSVGNFLNSDSSAKKLPADVIRFLHLKLQDKIYDLSSDARKAIGIEPKSTKETLLEKVKTLSKDELIEYMKTDTAIK